MDVIASECSSTPSGEELAGAKAELLRVLVEEAHLAPVPIRLLEVVAEQLVELAGGAGVGHPVGEPLVECCPKLLGHRIVGGIPYEDVLEAESIFTARGRGVGANETFADERQQLRRERGPLLARQESRNGRDGEVPADHGGALDHVSLVRAQPVEPLGEERLDRGRNRELTAVLGGHRADLLHEERVSLCGGRDALPDLRRQRGIAREVGQQRFRRGLRERAERERLVARLRRRPVRPVIDELRPRDWRRRGSAHHGSSRRRTR